MLRERFYAIVHAARPANGPRDPSASPESLREALSRLEVPVIVEFVQSFNDELAGLNRWDIWEVGYVAEGGMSDDAFRYFCNWLVGKGAEAVDAVKTNPDSLADFLGREACQNEELEYVGLDLLAEHDIPDPRSPSESVGGVDEPVGSPFTESDAELHFPRTAAAARTRWSELP